MTRTIERQTACGRRRRQRGLSMVELLVGLAISSFIILGTVFVYSQSRNTYSLNDTQARLQEYGRFAIGVIEPDLQLAGYYGFSNNPADLRYYDGGTEYPISKLEQGDTAIITTPTVLHDCGNNFDLDLLMTVQGTNGKPAAGKCEQKSGDYPYVDGTDTFTIRRASTSVAAVTSTRIQLYVNSLKRTNQYIFNADTAPNTVDATREVRNLVVRTYYVSKNSERRVGTPALRRIYLDTDAVTKAPTTKDEEVLPNIEDMQVQFGIDTGDHNADGKLDVDDDSNGVPDDPNGVISKWVEPDDDLLKAPPTGRKAQVVAVRVWLRIRSDDPEVAGYTDDRTYSYAGVNYKPAGAEAKFRRILVSRTVYLRNARTL